jgi:protein involved in polysaccharide export with SLBB domain
MRLALLWFGLLIAAGAANAQIVKPAAAPPQTTQTQPPPSYSPPQLPADIGMPSVFPTPTAPPRAATTPAPPAPAAPKPPAPGNQLSYYAGNFTSDVFGAHLFTGAFAQSSASIFNPDHVIGTGDQLQVRLWGAYEFDSLLTVDPQGNIFMPQAGPIGVAGVRNRDLHKVLEDALRKVFRANVYSYISLAAAQPVRVFVTGFVHRPGMYYGTSTDSVLRYLDQAAGIDPERGSFIDVQVKRNGEIRANVDLYQFLLNGRMPVIQFADGDVIFVTPRQNTVKVTGLAENVKRFEFRTADARTVADLARVAKPFAQATHVRVVRNTGTVKDTEYYPLAAAASVELRNGDEMIFTADQRPGTITVRVEGEHESAQEYVLPYGSRMGALIKQLQFTERSDQDHLQLFRVSVKERQKLALWQALDKLESTILTARSGTVEETRLRTEEAQLMLQWVDRARKIEPLGQVVVARAKQRDSLLLENGDVFRVPSKDGLVLVSGEVLFPNAVAYEPGYDLDAYIKRTGGYTQTADTSRILVARRDGTFDLAENGVTIGSGDEILVLPRVETKPRQFWKDVVQIIFQLALAAKVVID